VQRGLIAKICPQSSPRWQSAFSLPEFNISSFTEDCLVLDVIVPKLAFDNASIVEQGELVGASVLVWIHVCLS
jgi:carboxylesterase type B